ncbi:class I SAM-dependent methyltransferase [Yunchengibacter salinarum]|uniref:class I SAM-dependent methyltransferase n=1 Tax=Yunchengibacter salinarum TaxID=3133399 RepID=UPI0035B67011
MMANRLQVVKKGALAAGLILAMAALLAGNGAFSPAVGQGEDAGAARTLGLPEGTRIVAAGDITVPEPLRRAVDSDKRPDEDRLTDKRRKPARMLAFLGAAPGMEVLDLFSGGGYHSEILARLVGPHGHVVAHNNRAYIGFKQDTLAGRFMSGRLPQASQLIVEGDDLDFRKGRFDLILMSLTYHDFFWTNDTWPGVDAARLLSELFDATRSGGVVGVVDHRAPDGHGIEGARELHRIEPQVVIDQMREAGFSLVAATDLFTNPDDPLDVPMWNPSVRGHTDRFVLKFRKPGEDGGS